MSLSLFSMPASSLLQTYAFLSNRQDRIRFSQVCRRFHKIALRVEGSKKVCSFVKENFDIITESSSLKSVTPLNLLKMNVLLLSDIHCSDYHRRLNSLLINALFDADSAVFTESGDGSQIPYVDRSIRREIKCWDLESKWEMQLPSLHIMHCMLSICSSYIKNFKSGSFDFDTFLLFYKDIHKSQLSNSSSGKVPKNFLAYLEVQDICTKAKLEKDLIRKKELFFSLTSFLLNEYKDALNLRSRAVNEDIVARDLSLCSHIEASREKGEHPILVAGHAHIVSALVQGFVKKNGITCIALKPRFPAPRFPGHNLQDESSKIKDNDLECLHETIAFENNFWSEALQLHKLISAKPDDIINILNSHRELVVRIKEKMSSYLIDLENIPLWNMLPLVVYVDAVLVLKSG